MSIVNGIGGEDRYWSDKNIQNNQTELELEDISILYTTDKIEEERSSFSETYNNASLGEAADGAKFLQGLIENKTLLQEELGISDTEYDNLACVALALASQETGMGHEAGYQSENKGIGKFFRSIAKWFDVKLFGGKTASSGLTQMKIYDFMHDDSLSDEQKQILSNHGIEVSGYTNNNLFDNPDKSAVATMVVLKSICDNYVNYSSLMANEHEKLKASISDEENDRGENILNSIINTYNSASTEKQSQIRTTFKNWLLSTNGSKLSDKGDRTYNEEYQLNELNKLLGDDITLTQDDLNYIRYTLTANEQSFTMTEYCAYAWNKGTQETGMQLDRILSEKIGTLLMTPEEFDYDQFTANVSALAQKYALQALQ